jgi:hypothetical protein
MQLLRCFCALFYKCLIWIGCISMLTRCLVYIYSPAHFTTLAHRHIDWTQVWPFVNCCFYMLILTLPAANNYYLPQIFTTTILKRREMDVGSSKDDIRLRYGGDTAQIGRRYASLGQELDPGISIYCNNLFCEDAVSYCPVISRELEFISIQA